MNQHPQEDLAKSDREVEKIQNRAIVWRPVVAFWINLTIGEACISGENFTKSFSFHFARVTEGLLEIATMPKTKRCYTAADK